MEANNPYAPPQARVLDVDTSYGLKHRSVWVVIVFCVLTLGLYYLIWFLRRRPGLNRLNSPRKLSLWPLVLLGGLYVLAVVEGLVAGDTPLELVIGVGFTLLLQLVQLAISILMIIQCFKIKDIIEDHAAPADPTEPFAQHVKLSGLMTFFFSIFYLQWSINRYVIAAPSKQLQ
jgi:hypothetical protein